MLRYWQRSLLKLLSCSVACAPLLVCHFVNAGQVISTQPVTASQIQTTAVMIEDGLVNDDIRQAYFTPVASKQALVCSLSSLVRCIALLPSSLQQQTAFSVANIRRAVGRKSAMVLVAEHRTIAGVIIINPANNMAEQSGAIGFTTYQLRLANQMQLTLWHEIGHLYNIALQGSILPSSLTEYQHEWLADLYLLWRIGQHYQQLDLGWQQFHRRNLALINDSANLSHWSAPQLQVALNHYDAQQLKQFTRYEDFITAVYPLMPTWSTHDLGEFSSLIQRTFSAAQSLPKYMFWRQSDLIEVLSPTLERFMGKTESQRWLKNKFFIENNM
ncbi:hypothetical protein H5202_01310 [Shewanella sp. SG41-4]|uniref:hypothetical protein n=1 Tax=Shewanella sp. SG41-4 TaxID=2760976 RepID=UPI001600220F|nr:hypothetical protein [Shewanella sp. SG41-4]MBB1437323.1 hypothetical protein [Shewanella sp. SG41-4]